MAKLGIRKSAAKRICRWLGLPLIKAARNPKDPRFEEFKAKIIAHLEELEKQETRLVCKSIAYLERLEKAGRKVYQVGDIATWKNGKFIKGPDKKWRRYYEGHSKLAETAITRLKGQAKKCQNSSELWDLVANNWGRFMDKDKMPLPMVRDFHKYVSTIEDEINAGVAVENRTAHKRGRARGSKRKSAPTGKQILDFVEDALSDGSKTRVLELGEIRDEAKVRIKEKTGLAGVERIIIDTSSVRHSFSKQNHNLVKDDFLKIADIVNTTDDITLDNKRHSDNATGIFFEKTDDKNTALKLVVEFREKKGNLALVSFYRQKKKRATAPMPTKVSPKLTSETVTAHEQSIQQTKEKAREKNRTEVLSEV